MNQERIGALIKEIRKDNNLTQKDLAKKLGVTYQAVSKWESGTAYPDTDKLIQISKIFNVSFSHVDSLFTGGRHYRFNNV